MVFHRMPKILSRSVSIQKKFISKCPKAKQHGIVLYNENPRKTNSLIICFNDRNHKIYQSNDFKRIRSSDSRIFRLFSNYFVLYKDLARTIVPVINEQIDKEEIPRIGVLDYLKWLAKAADSGDKASIQPGTRIGRLDAANESGFFHRTDRSRLKEIKGKLKDKAKDEPTEPKKAG